MKLFKLLIILLYSRQNQAIGMNALDTAKKYAISCNRNLIYSLLPENEKFDKAQDYLPTREIKKQCTKINISCCSEKEVLDLLGQIEKLNPKLVKQQITRLHKFLKNLTLSKYKAMIFQNQNNCSPKITIDLELKKFFNTKLDHLIKSIDESFEYARAHYKGIVCSMCNAQTNQFLLPILDKNQNEILRITIDQKSCRNHFLRELKKYPYIEFIYRLMDFTEFMFCTSKKTSNYFEDYSYEEFNKIKKTIETCSKVLLDDLFKDSQCKEICISMHNLVLWDDFLDSFKILERADRIERPRTLSRMTGDLEQVPGSDCNPQAAGQPCCNCVNHRTRDLGLAQA